MLSANEIHWLCHDAKFKLGSASVDGIPVIHEWLGRDCLKAPIKPTVLVERYEDGPPATAYLMTLGAPNQMMVGTKLTSEPGGPIRLYPGEVLLGWVDVEMLKCGWAPQMRFDLGLTFEAVAAGLKLNGFGVSSATGELSVAIQNSTYGHVIELPIGHQLIEIRFIRLETSRPYGIVDASQMVEISKHDPAAKVYKNNMIPGRGRASKPLKR